MWKIVGASIQGRSHKNNDIPCQDRIGYFRSDNSNCIALSDGAGSVKYAEIGAQITCDTVCGLFNCDFNKLYSLHLKELQSKIIHNIRTRIGIKASKLGVQKSEFSATMLFVCIYDDQYIIGHIGDGVIAGLKNNSLVILSEPENGEYANSTYFVTSKKIQNHFRIIKGNISDIRAFYLMSDGAAECLYHKKDKILSNALNIISSWIDNNEENVVSDALKANMQELFYNHTYDDCSIIILQNCK